MTGFRGDDCSITAVDEVPVLVYIFQAFFAFSFSLCGAVGVFAYAANKKTKATGDFSQVFFNVKKAVLFVLVILCLNSVLYIVLSGLNLLLPFFIIQLSYGLSFPLLSLLFTLVLFHWADVYQTTTKILRREEMLEKINSQYESKVTLEDVVSKTRFMSKLRIPFLVLNGFAFIVGLARDIAFVSIPPPRAIHYVWSVVFLFLYFFEGIGFLIYGRKVVSVLPDILAVKMRRVTKSISIIAVLFISTFVLAGLAFALTVDNAWVFVLGTSVWRLGLLVVVVFVLSLFVRPRMQRQFPYFVFNWKGSSSKPSNLTSGTPAVVEGNRSTTESGDEENSE